MTAGLRPPHPYFNAVLVYPPPAPLECEVDGCHEYPLYECCIQHTYVQPKGEQTMSQRRRFGESESKYLKGSDLETPNGVHAAPTVTIDTITDENIGEDKEPRYILYFVGKEKGVVLNVTNENTLIDLFGPPPGDDLYEVAAHYHGKPVQLYFDPTVTFAGKRVGGLRLRAAPGATPEPAPPPPPADDSIPF